MKSSAKPARARVILDLSEWELGDWPKDLLDQVVFDTDASMDPGHRIEISVSLDADAFTEVARKIAKEAVEMFLTNSHAQIIRDGVLFETSDALDKSVRIPWSSDEPYGADVEIVDQGWLGKLIDMAGYSGSLTETPLRDMVQWLIDGYRRNADDHDIREALMAIIEGREKERGPQPPTNHNPNPV